MIRVAGLAVRIGAAPIVQGVSFAVPAGGAFGLVGESGSGKSTILRALAGLNPDWTGQVAFDGVAAWAAARTARLLRQVQMVFQDPYGSLHPRQTVDRALSEPLAVHGLGERDARIAARAGRGGRCPAPCASATRTSSPAGSASVWPSPAR